MALNNIVCLDSKFTEIDYAKYDCIAVMLCKECLPALANLRLPENVLKSAELYLQKNPDIYEVGVIQYLTVLQEAHLQHVLLIGCGTGKDCTPNNFRKAAGCTARAIKQLRCTEAVIAAPILFNEARAHYLEALTEGLYLGAYTFKEFKSKTLPEITCQITVANNIANGAKVMGDAAIIAESVSFTRNLVNRPGNVVTPDVMIEEAEKIAAEENLTLEILDEEMLAAYKMNALLAVGQGSSHKPCLIMLKYQGAQDQPFTAFVGKGITFDSGGISIKPDDNMGEMKDDMSGAGAVLGAIKAIARLKLPCNIMAVLACAENMPDGDAQRPGDIVKAANGKTIEVISTDAEGRMVLADAVWYACRQGAKKVVDIATLTGAVIIALGKETSAVVGNDDELIAQVIKAGKMTGEIYWQLPSLPECKEALRSDVADLLNSAGRSGGCITGGLFIGEFVEPGTAWAHLDIGGTSTADKTSGFKVKGGTGFGTMTLIKLAGTL